MSNAGNIHSKSSKLNISLVRNIVFNKPQDISFAIEMVK